MTQLTQASSSLPATPSLTCGELLVQWLEYYGVETVFGIPGVHTVELYRGLPNTNIRHVTPRHEQGAGFMADGYYRASGKIGVCFIITGPGMTNIMTAMAQALADSIPMLVISSVNKVADTGSGEGHLHELHDQQGMVSKVALTSKTIWKPESLPKVIAEAFALFNGARPGPVHIQLPIDVITADASHVAKPPDLTPYLNSPATSQTDANSSTLPRVMRPLPNPAQLDLIIESLKTAKNPVLLYGGGCVDVNQDAQKLAELIDAPTFLTINAKGLLPPAHPLSLGSNQSLAAGRAVITEADLVLAIGTELGETDYDVFFNGEFKINGKLIRIDCDAQQLQRPFRADIAVLSDAQMAISGLCTRLENQALNHKAVSRVAEAKQALLAEMTPDFAGQNALLQLIRDEVKDVIFVGDSTQPVYSGNLGFEALATRKWFNSSTGFGTLGYGLPAAIGAMIGSKSPVISLIGDGGIQFTIAELICAAELELPLIVLLWNNQGYGEIRRYMEEGGLPLIGVNIKTPHFEPLAAGFGAGYRRITEKQQLLDALQKDINGKQPFIYEIDEADDFLTEIGKDFICFS
ncbi:5-guanidino-2-oxopentanoate decarboxylase [Psychrobacter sp. N25K4-3-2]|uniref:5-guanidino-2-oxopentanoate decarboxylase n=1 Tax=Psychrobacter sp. N25K4-3-2 TaxID=2785026 RepID=UPI001889FF5E|nr:5-guanidino-2-oxopentanoate decarboxylase [Psychrobacter sp. N25K4-3-2]MBF4489489.1 5-guanidino-2-oxopentanoate decarboxylase [Psychrobacter sp. N25K4-3-2]